MFSIYVNLIELSLFPTFSNISSVFLPRKILSNIHRSSRPAVVQLECTWLQLIRNDKRRIQTCATHTHTQSETRISVGIPVPDGVRSGLNPQYADRFQASSIENKQDWIKHIREVIQERTIHLRGALKEPIHIPKATTAKHHKGRR